MFPLHTVPFTTSLGSRFSHTLIVPALSSSQVQRRESKRQTRWCLRLSLLRLRAHRGFESVRAPLPRLGLVILKWKNSDKLLNFPHLTPRADVLSPASPVSWPSPCRRSWRRGGSSLRLSPTASEAAGQRWKWTSTAPTPRRPSPSTTSTRDASSRHTSTCESRNRHTEIHILCEISLIFRFAFSCAFWM